ncbi:hypothetical protein AZE42_08657 [Rhizopogon vesiculosus]|uniref:Uncharacterized protein n=1 Tax=Rhizopogon vesiculosus TaxID=180088 RepID=A0A1J8QMV7_9AGAM|nr:hypothetical protein AZE42_08657 [Rhizopogon vesiculosus]
MHRLSSSGSSRPPDDPPDDAQDGFPGTSPHDSSDADTSEHPPDNPPSKFDHKLQTLTMEIPDSARPPDDPADDVQERFSLARDSWIDTTIDPTDVLPLPFFDREIPEDKIEALNFLDRLATVPASGNLQNNPIPDPTQVTYDSTMNYFEPHLLHSIDDIFQRYELLKLLPLDGLPAVSFHYTFPEYSSTHSVPGNLQNDTILGGIDHMSGCEWNDGNGPCRETLNARRDSIKEHMLSHKLKSVPHNSMMHCQWGGCDKNLRRDTLLRHITERHFGIKRLASKGARDMAP